MNDHQRIVLRLEIKVTEIRCFRVGSGLFAETTPEWLTPSASKLDIYRIYHSTFTIAINYMPRQHL
jgi:hypothetical protein